VDFQTTSVRIARAKAHRKTIDEIWSEYLDEPDPYDTGIHVYDDGTGEITLQPSRPLPVALSLELGEMLYQLRAALDSCIYQAAIFDSRQDPPSYENALEFPICATERAFEDSAWKIAPLTNQTIREFIHDVQPCNIPNLSAGAVWVPETLRLLNDWARKDRHRRLHIVGSWPAWADPNLRVPEGVTIRSMTVVGLGLLLNEQSVLAEFCLDGWEPGMKIEANPDVAIDIASDEAPPPKDASDTLDTRTQRMIAVVRLVQETFEKAY
jgi:hypothetical protein